MQINFNPSINKAYSQNGIKTPSQNDALKENAEKAKSAINDMIQKVDDEQKVSDASIQDLLTGKNQDINSVIANVAKADSSFNLLVGVRNKLIEAYKETMRMQV